MLLAAPQAAIIRAALVKRVAGCRGKLDTPNTTSLNSSSFFRHSDRNNLVRRGYQALSYAKDRILNPNLRRVCAKFARFRFTAGL